MVYISFILFKNVLFGPMRNLLFLDYIIIDCIYYTGGPPSVEMRGSKAAEFVLKCLVKIPTKICVSLANKVSVKNLAQTALLLH